MKFVRTQIETCIGRRSLAYGEMTRLAAVVAATTSTSTAQAKSRAVGLNVAKALAVVALLSLGGTRQRAAIGLVSFIVQVSE